LRRACVPSAVLSSLTAARFTAQWKKEHNLREVQTMRRYHIQDRDDYKKYNKLCGLVTKLVRARSGGLPGAVRGCTLSKPGLVTTTHFPDACACMSPLQVAVLRKMDPADATRLAVTQSLLEKLYAAGAIPSARGSLALCDKLSTSSFCRRRLAVVLVRLKMAETLAEAATFVEQGHVRVGPDTVTDPAFLVTRAAEDFVTWADTSTIRRKVQQYNDALDDFDLLNA
jgi:U3 small nucleolar ribonucleoprotein protein IMP3